MNQLFKRLTLTASLLTSLASLGCGTPTTQRPVAAAQAATMEVAVEDELDASSYETTTEQVTFSSRGAELVGTVVRPVTDGKRPAVVIAHDWGVRGRDGIVGAVFGVRLPTEVALYRSLAESLAARGIVVLIFDKRTCTRGSEPWCTYPPEQMTDDLGGALVDDVRAAAVSLAGRPDVASVSLLGHGHGAEVAMVAATDARVGRVALLQPSYADLPALAKFQVETSIQQIDARIAEVGDVPEADLLKQQRDELQQRLAEPNPLGITAATATTLADLHTQYHEQLAATRLPLFAIIGRVDPGEPPASRERIEALLGDRVLTIADLTRAMTSVSPDDDPTVIDAEVIARLAAFLGGASR